MISYNFADIFIGVDIHPNLVGKINFPDNFILNNELLINQKHDIVLILDTKSFFREIKQESVLSQRGNFYSTRSENNIYWSHPVAGLISKSNLDNYMAEISFEEKYWNKLESPFDQVILPSLIPLLAARGLRLIHASAVKYKDQTILLAGQSKSGKSTFTIKMLLAGAKIITDDESFVKAAENMINVYGLNDHIQAGEKTWNMFPEFNLETSFNGKLQYLPEVGKRLNSAPVNSIFVLSDSYKLNVKKSSFITNILNYTYFDDNLRDAVNFANIIADNCSLNEYYYIDDVINTIMNE